MGEISINVPFFLYRGMLLLRFQRGEKTWSCHWCNRTLSKGASEVVRRCTCNTITSHCAVLIWKSQSLAILLKTWFLKTYYSSNSFLQSQASKCSCSHSLRLYMFHCLDTGLDNSHQCLKKKTKDVVRINDNKTSISTNYRTHTYTRFTCRINWRHSVLFHKSTTQWKFFWN